MNIHIIGICGTFMGGIARMAKTLGHTVSGSDQNTYPPMSTQLESMGVELFEGYSADNIAENIDIVIVGNTISRGNPELEHVLNNHLHFTSGAQWLHENVLRDKWVVAVSGTHGKTTTSSLITWILEYCGYEPSYLIGGVPANFGESSRLTDSMFFVIEADEYDTAFSDKRSKFVHYAPNTLVINNLEFDHADIFNNLEDIQTQFHHLLKILPENGQVIYNQSETSVQQTISKGCWSEQQTFEVNDSASEKITTSDWSIHPNKADASEFTVSNKDKEVIGKWDLIGQHNLNNAITAIAAVNHVGVTVEQAIAALPEFKSVARRLETKAQGNGVTIYDDFAHHPTAITLTLDALRNNVGSEKIVAVLEARSNTMKMGYHKDKLADSLQKADTVYVYLPESIEWRNELNGGDNMYITDNFEQLLQSIQEECNSGSPQVPTHVLIMSNGGFQGIHSRLEKTIINT